MQPLPFSMKLARYRLHEYILGRHPEDHDFKQPLEAKSHLVAYAAERVIDLVITQVVIS